MFIFSVTVLSSKAERDNKVIDKKVDVHKLVNSFETDFNFIVIILCFLSASPALISR